jgi:hypothetical protein
MLLVIIEPNFGGVVGPAAVDVEEFVRVGDGRDPVFISRGITKLGAGCPISRTHQYWPLPFLSGMICVVF